MSTPTPTTAANQPPDWLKLRDGALKPGVRGVYNVVGPGEVPLSFVLRELGRRPIPVPHPLVRPLLRRAFQARLTGYPPEEVDHIQYLCAVDGSRWVKEVGWKPAYSMRETIRSVLADVGGS